METNNSCKHINWYIYGTERIGFGTCLKCNKHINVSELINNTMKRIKELEIELLKLLIKDVKGK